MNKNREKKIKHNNRKIRVLSGIRASHESVHLGVYFGAMKGMIRLQNDPKYETFYMVADLHGITTPFISKELKENRLGIAMDYLAAGIDPNKSVLFYQSDVHEHTELAFYLSSVMSFNRLRKLPSYKEKLKEFPKASTVALFNYPVLMAADILLYKAEKVPIGADQEYHLEVTRVIANKMNKKYGLDFPLPERFVDIKEKIPDLYKIDKKRKVSKKMSKTAPKGAIFLTDTANIVRKKISKVSTSVNGGKKFPRVGGDHTLYVLTKLFISDERAKQFKNDYLNRTVKYSDLKSELSVAISKELKKIQVERKKYEENPELVERILAEGALKASSVAKRTMSQVKKAMGLKQTKIHRSSYGLHNL